jgi:hypothetical protein
LFGPPDGLEHLADGKALADRQLAFTPTHKILTFFILNCGVWHLKSQKIEAVLHVCPPFDVLPLRVKLAWPNLPV